MADNISEKFKHFLSSDSDKLVHFMNPEKFVETRDSVRKKLRSGEYITREHGGKSTVWQSFMGILSKNLEPVNFVTCKRCGEVFSYKGNSSGTSTLRKHLAKCQCHTLKFDNAPDLVPHPIVQLLANAAKKLSEGNAIPSSSSQYQDAVSDNTADDVSVDLSPEQILGEDSNSQQPAPVPSSPPTNRPESFKLSHNNHLSIVLEALAADEAFMDVTLTAQGKSVKAHKSVLSAVSSYFNGVLRENPCQHPIIIMPRDVTFEQLKSIITYIYKGEMTVPATELSNLLRTAELLQVSGLSPSENENVHESLRQSTSVQQTPPSKKTSSAKFLPKATKKRPRSESLERAPSPKRFPEVKPPVAEFIPEDTYVKEEMVSDDEHEEYPPGHKPTEEISGSLKDIVSINNETSQSRRDADDPLNVPKESNFICEHCNQAFESKNLLNNHVQKNHQSAIELVCPCGKSFTNQVDFEDHKKSCLMS